MLWALLHVTNCGFCSFVIWSCTRQLSRSCVQHGISHVSAMRDLPECKHSFFQWYEGSQTRGTTSWLAVSSPKQVSLTSREKRPKSAFSRFFQRKTRKRFSLFKGNSVFFKNNKKWFCAPRLREISVPACAAFSRGKVKHRAATEAKMASQS